MSYLPVMLDLRGRRALVVGGGEMAAAKIAKLLEAAADVTVVAEALADAVRTEVTDGRVHWVQRAFAEGDCEGFAVVVAAEETGAPNGRIAADATRFGALVNAGRRHDRELDERREPCVRALAQSPPRDVPRLRPR